METARIAALLEPFLESSLSPSQLDQISIYIDLLLRWNARINLTAIRKEEEIITRHFGESFFLARHLFPTNRLSVARSLLSANADTAQPPAIPPSPNPCHPERSHVIREADGAAESKDPYPAFSSGPTPGVLTAPSNPPRVLDIGSGAGFPALPLKIWAPQIHLTLIESNHKKAAFLREAARTLTLTNVNVIAGRAETISARADVVTLRAVECFETILPLAATLLAPNGRLALLIGAAQLPHLAPLTSLKWCPPISVPQSHSRVLSISIPKQSGK
jgi:16S rRNA (guanine(527)-N(7))-methyltransferase RsmG